VEYALGASYPAGDGCNTCTCTEQGSVCTRLACNACLTIENEYVVASAAAKACDPALDSAQCTKRSPLGLACGCTTFVNPDHAGAEMKLRELEAEYAQAGCGGGVLCGACAEPVSAFCTAAGTCQDFFGDGSGAGGGPSGEAGAAGAAGEGALTSCPQARPALGAACAGEFTCNYDDTCLCGTCCFSTLACREGVVTLLGSNDACRQIPC
jgi:hypothetical protein